MSKKRTLKTTIIEVRPRSIISTIFTLPRYRAFYGFLFREILMRKFRNTFLGFWWLIIRPLIPAAVFVFLFTFVRPMQGDGGVPYVLFFLVGFMTWNLFHSTIIFMPRTLLWMQGIMRRTYFPRLLIPLAGFGPPLVELIVLMTLTLSTVGYVWLISDNLPLELGWKLLMFPLALTFALMFGVALGMFASVFAVFFSDVVFSIPYIAQILMFLTPVIYPIDFIPESYRPYIYIINPMAIQVEMARWSLIGLGDIDWSYYLLSVLSILATFICAVIFFVKAEAIVSDQI